MSWLGLEWIGRSYKSAAVVEATRGEGVANNNKCILDGRDKSTMS
jgi:hypothetical protein